jgi:riboflavin kinase/FMN adenylyltransferase
MKVYQGLGEFTQLQNAIVTAGTFDGVHVGHQKILERLTKVAKQTGGESVLITFWPHPRLVLDPANATIELLTTFAEKAKLLEQQGLNHLIKIHFTKEFAKTSSREFIKEILVNIIGTKKLVIGYDHRFGHNREGSFEALKDNAHQYGFTIEEIPRQDVEHVGVSSSRIRRALSNGEIHISNQYLGWEYSITGKVVHGDRRGRTIGFPTANLEVNSPFKLIPSHGSYAVRVTYEEVSYQGMLNIGVRPTVSGERQTIEVHIFDFNQDLYGKTLTVSFVKLIRKETKFANLEALKLQLQSDQNTALRLLRENQ